MSVLLAVTRVSGSHHVALPAHQTESSAGLDLTAESFDVDGARATTHVLAPGDRMLARTGIALAIPAGYAGLVCPRSGLALLHGIGLVNSPGVIDADYRGEVGVILINHGREDVVLERGMRVAQLVLVPCARAEVTEVPALGATARGAGGFGSTG
jgi:dUTP pyrophosphatase